ncbi:CotS family spore coat protein [Paenibacillus aestuarii]|uniref:CotS family spore coat protein n=1 Tax=Paenibacillus aestuarii TaxID=516965 RepID=A0ABW0KC61_9BACL|nr:CotS family spore coat protein [Paenibacillus aestuarii]
MSATNELQALGEKLMASHYSHIQVNQIEVIQSGGIKTIWKMQSAVGTICLKRIRKPLPIVKFTTAAQAYLAGRGALVASILPTKSGELYFVHEGHALVLYSWIEGTDLDMERNEEHLRAGLRGIARFERDSLGFQPPSDCEVYDKLGKWPLHYAKMTQELIDWKAIAEEESSKFHETYAQLAVVMIAAARQALDLLRTSAYAKWVAAVEPYGYLSHQDYGKGNALQTERGVYILDLDNLTYDLPLRDLRKLITKRMDELGTWTAADLNTWISYFEEELPLTDERRRVLYIDLLFPHTFYGEAKKPFKKGDTDYEPEKLIESFEFEIAKNAVLQQLLASTQ